MSTETPIQPAPSFADRFPLFMRAAFLAAWGVAVFNTLRLARYWAGPFGALGEDARAYWLTGQRELWYGLAPGADGAFLYSPAFAQAISPLVALPWPVFAAGWIALEVAALLWLLKPVPRRWAVPIGLLCLPELFVGNIYLLLAVVAVAGLRHPSLWSFAALTKVTPGVGVLWFAVRREWRQVGVAAAATAIITAGSYLAAPETWHAWVGFLLSNQGASVDGRIGFALRCVGAVVLVVYGARTDRAWVVPLAMLLASPMNLNAPAATLLLALPRLVSTKPSRRSHHTFRSAPPGRPTHCFTEEGQSPC